jgi:hypothetical protein
MLIHNGFSIGSLPLLLFVLVCGIIVETAAQFATAAEDQVESGGRGDPYRQENSRAVAEVRAEKRTTAYAAWWGFDEADSTRFLQAAIDSGAAKVIVSNMGKDWIITPITLAANQELVLEPGVVVTAKRGAFKGSHDSLFRAQSKGNITIGGYGATLRMQKKDYMSDAYQKAEWRSAIYFDSCHAIKVYGLTIRDTGGDGVYLGDAGEPGYNRDVVIEDVLFDNNYRQGISVISAENVAIHNCVFKDTGGTGPAGGIDLETDHPSNRLVNITVRNCIAENNQGPGFIVSPAKLSSESADISVLFENCYVRSGRGHGLMVSGVKDDGPQGLIEFKNCHVCKTRLHGARILDKSAESARVRFVNCTWSDVATGARDAGGYDGVPNLPIMIHLRGPAWSVKPGGVDFVDCLVDDRQNRPFIAFKATFENAPPVHDVKGNITVNNTFRAETDFGHRAVDVTLRINR